MLYSAEGHRVDPLAVRLFVAYRYDIYKDDIAKTSLPYLVNRSCWQGYQS